ncbi:adenylate cyclase domain-containing protein [Heterostelium album PN500]|uniref:Adenylate cyclase domain-containing protein n=1 Tax=Heterostelium pallidum (strain ATCC 26659 / Pp 5 / PN500) TaxID=670386 RepID=D3BK77_HETP5|nr:adenylate cyclase domain-containing protein [Heterostelium album PN500]EFA78307.1 adenylate cyclase domain-containing protein [Heterostelium album PN500]|eukprot:XP_020430432.1 adenylate cyclase domain-containing protein [Heterostelium album PN500]
MDKVNNRILNLTQHLLVVNPTSATLESEQTVANTTNTAAKTAVVKKSKHDADIESDGSIAREKLNEEELDITVEMNTKTNQYEIKTVPNTLSFDQGFFHAIRAIELLAEADPQRGIVIGIAGPVGAGKTTLAQKISGLVNALVIDLQDFVKLEMVKDNNYDDPILIDYDKVVESLNNLKKNQPVDLPTIIKHKETGIARVEIKRVTLPASKVLILEGSYALSAKIRPLLDISIAITGGVHLDLIKRIMRDIVIAKSSTKDVLLQITNVVFPMFKAFVEPDLDQAKIKIHSSYNPMSQVVEPTYVCKAKYESHKENFDQFLTSLNKDVKPVKKIFSDMYLYPPKSIDGISQADKTNWIRIRRTDKGQFNIYFYREVMDATINTRPSLNFEISVKTIGGLLSLGYQIGAILNRTVEVWYEKSGIIVTKEYIKELEKYFIQIKGQNRREVIEFADKLKMTNIHVPQTFLYLYFKKLKKNKLRSEANKNNSNNTNNTNSNTIIDSKLQKNNTSKKIKQQQQQKQQEQQSKQIIKQ